MEIIENFIEPFKITGLLACFFCGAAIGIERQLSGKPAGIRTSLLICFSTYIFASMSSFLIEDIGDPSRVIGQIVTGVGFLGGGVMLTKDGLVMGVTSAAIIWLLAALGCLIAFEYELQAVIFTVVGLFLLVGIGFLERSVKKLKEGVHKNNHGE